MIGNPNARSPLTEQRSAELRAEHMIKVYLFIELLRAASASDVTAKLREVEFDGCKFANIVVLADDNSLPNSTAKMAPRPTQRF